MLVEYRGLLWRLKLVGGAGLMSYLENFDHDAFVSYAHSELNCWSKHFVDRLQYLVNCGLRSRCDKVQFWFDEDTEGNAPLTDNLKYKVSRSCLLIVLLTDQYLDF